MARWVLEVVEFVGCVTLISVIVFAILCNCCFCRLSKNAHKYEDDIRAEFADFEYERRYEISRRNELSRGAHNQLSFQHPSAPHSIVFATLTPVAPPSALSLENLTVMPQIIQPINPHNDSVPTCEDPPPPYPGLSRGTSNDEPPPYPGLSKETCQIVIENFPYNPDFL